MLPTVLQWIPPQIDNIDKQGNPWKQKQKLQL